VHIALASSDDLSLAGRFVGRARDSSLGSASQSRLALASSDDLSLAAISLVALVTRHSAQVCDAAL